MIKNKIFTVLLLGIMAMMSGCSFKASKDAVVVHNMQSVNKHDGSISINARSNGLDITDIDFAKAIEESIIENDLFAKVIHGNGADYLLEVSIISIEKPVFGLDFTVNMEATWSIKDPLNNKIIMRKAIKSSYTATFGDALVGVKRLRLAIEGAIRKNIRLGLLDMSALQLNK